MMQQMYNVAKLELSNLYGFNVLRFTKDKREKKKKLGMLAVGGLLIIILFGYVGSLSVGLIMLDMEQLIPSYLIVIFSMLAVFLGIFKAGGILFKKQGYDMLCALPIPKSALVGGRFLRLYIENLILELLILLPGLGVYACMIKPEASFYLLVTPMALAAPLIPVSLVAFLGAFVSGIASRMRHKGIAEAVLSIAVVVGIVLFTPRLDGMEDNFNMEMLKNLSIIIREGLEKMYPFGVWLGDSVAEGNGKLMLICVGISLLIFTISVTLVSCFFHSICRSLFVTSARHDYQMKELKSTSVLMAMVKKEFRGYFSSGVYVSNTILGPIMGMILAGAIAFVGLDEVKRVLEISIEIGVAIPYAIGAVFAMMTTTCCAISMEGKTWWIAQTLPLSAKTILDAKILMNLLLTAPFYIIAECLLIFGLRPMGWDLVWMILAPAVLCLFSCVYGITINLCFPVLNWENEVTVVKQSISTLLGGMGGMLLGLVCAVMVLLVPDTYKNYLQFTLCVALLATTYILYCKNNQKDVKKIS